MNFRPTLSISVAFITLATLANIGSSQNAIPNVHAQEPASDASGTPTFSLQDKIELARIRLAIRLQEVQVAKAERPLLDPNADVANETLKAKEQELLAVETQLLRLKDLQKEGVVALEKVQEAEIRRLATAAQVEAYRSSSAAYSAAYAHKIAVHDEKLKLLELRAQLAKTRFDQLKRQLKQ